MSRTIHHRKPGAPRTPAKGYIKQGRANMELRNAMRSLGVDLDTNESMSLRRTR